ncbi:MAG: DUF1573 domain-containing protein [Bacteroidota bacterium]|nr:DUF1573 domain-containing protein [Bacteroidota bacterium]
MNKLYILSFIIMIAACNGNKPVGTDIVNNPKTASGKKGTGKGPMLTFDKITQDFGTIKSNGSHPELIFNFTNTGDEPLVITNVQAGCSCTTPEWPRDPIAPGKESYIKAVFDPTGKGTKDGMPPVVKTISVQSNSSKEPLQTLTLTGKVIEVIN